MEPNKEEKIEEKQELVDEQIEMNPTKEGEDVEVSQVEYLRSEVIRLEGENSGLVEKVKLAQAELINYRHRKDEETNSLLKYANQDIVTEMLQVVDNLERALKVNEEKASDDLKKFLTGVKMVHTNMLEVFKKYGVEEINRVGEVFDPKQEQALLTDCVEEMEDEVVIEVLQKGYKLKDRVIRPASVKINQK